MSRPGTIFWFARHEWRLAWRDWLWLMSGQTQSGAGSNRHHAVLAWFCLSGALSFGTLALVDGGRVGKHQLVERREVVGDVPAVKLDVSWLSSVSIRDTMPRSPL